MRCTYHFADWYRHRSEHLIEASSRRYLRSLMLSSVKPAAMMSDVGCRRRDGGLREIKMAGVYHR